MTVSSSGSPSQLSPGRFSIVTDSSSAKSVTWNGPATTASVFTSALRISSFVSYWLQMCSGTMKIQGGTNGADVGFVVVQTIVVSSVASIDSVNGR